MNPLVPDLCLPLDANMLTPATALTPDDLKAAILPNPLIVAPHCSIRDAIAKMASISTAHLDYWEVPQASPVSQPQAVTPASCVLIMAGGNLLGMLTEQQVVGLVAHNINLDGPIGQVMETDLVSLSSADLTSFRAIEKLFQRYPIRHLPVLDEAGQVLGVITLASLYQQLQFVDIYQGLLANASQVEPPHGLAQASETFFRNTFDQAAVGIAHVMPNGDFIRVNQRFCDIVGYSRRELLVSGFPNITHPDDLESDIRQFQTLLNGGRGTYTLEKRYIRRDGSLVWANLTVSLVRDPQGRPSYCIGVIEDITQRQAAEQKLKQQRDFSRLMAEITSSFVDVALPELDTAINHSLRKIGQATGVNTSYLFKFTTPLEQADILQDTMAMAYEWSQDPSHSRQAQAQRVPLRGFPWSMAQLQQRQAVNVAHTADLPPAAKQDQVSWQQLGVTSVLFMPLIQHAGVVGFIGFVCFDRPYTWDAHTLQLLQVMGQTIASAWERLQAEHQLQQSEQRFKKAVLDAPYPIMIHAEDGEVLQINQAWTDYSGYTAAELPTMADWTAKAYGQQQESVNTVINRLHTADSRVNEGEFAVQTKAGQKRVWDFSSAPLGHLPDGRRYVMSMAVDITDRRLAEAERLKSQQTGQELKLLETILDVILAGYWDWHIPTQRNYLSPGLKHMLGYQDDELPTAPNTWQQLIFPEDLPIALGALQHHIDSGGHQPYAVEVRYRHKNGSTVWVLCSGLLIAWDDAGNPAYVVGCHVDITRSKQAELKLQKSDKHLKTAQRIGKIGSWEFDVSTQQISWSDEVFRIFRRDPAAGPPTYDELLQMYLPEDAAKLSQIVKTSLATGQPYALECRGRHGDGTLFHIQARGEPVFNHSGTITHLVGTILDITERKQAEAKLLQMTAQLKASNQELEAFAYSVSHDLRSPLRAIDGFSQALLEDYGHLVHEDGLDYFQRIRSNVNRMGTLIDGLLRLSRVSRTAIHYQQVNLSALVQNYMVELQTTDPQRQVQVTIAPEVIVWADATLMGVVATNLLDNAWKFTSHRTTAHIEFGVCTSHSPPTYFVRDNGAGFDMAYSAMLFGVFQRLHNTDEFPGTGIGLATVQRAIHRHGGRVWAEAAVAQGATIFFTLPAATALGG